MRLIEISLLRLSLEQAQAIKVVISNKTAKVILKNLESLKDGKIMARLNDYKRQVTLTFEENPILVFTKEGLFAEDYLKIMLDFFTFE